MAQAHWPHGTPGPPPSPMAKPLCGPPGCSAAPRPPSPAAQATGQPKRPMGPMTRTHKQRRNLSLWAQWYGQAGVLQWMFCFSTFFSMLSLFTHENVTTHSVVKRNV